MARKFKRKDTEPRSIREQKDSLIAYVKQGKKLFDEGGRQLLLKSVPFAIWKAATEFDEIMRLIRDFVKKESKESMLCKKLSSVIERSSRVVY